MKATSENPKLCVTLLRQNAHLPYANSAFASVASLDFGVFGGCLKSFLRMFFIIAGLIATTAAAADARDNKGRVSGNVSDFSGSPVEGALIRVIQMIDGVENFTSTRSDKHGFFRTATLPGGVYSLQISHYDYRPAATTQFVVDDSRSVSLEIALQKFTDSFIRDEDPRNQGFMQVLRGASDRRLIFRSIEAAGVAENAPNPFTQGGVMSIASGSFRSEGYFLRPQASQNGVSSNFAFTEPLNSTSRIVMSGQIDSGAGSFWRLRNTYSRRVDRNNNYSISIGYGRMSGNYPVADAVSPSTNFFSMSDGLETISFGTEVETRLFDILAVRYGVDYSRLHYDSEKSFISPSLRILLTPVDGWSFEAFVTSRPQSEAGSITLPSGETLNLAEPTLITIAGDKASMSQVRHSEAVVRRNFTPETSVEVAFYQDYINGSGIPLFVTTVTPVRTRSCVIEMKEERLNQRGLRFMAKHRVFENLTGSVSYIYGESKEITQDARQAAVASLEENPENFMKQGYRHSIAGRIDTFIPMTRTSVITMLRWNSGYPLTTLDRFFDDMDIGTKSANLEIRQFLPVPAFLYGPGRWEVMLELSNALNQGSRKLTAADGEIIFDRNPRSIRFGLNYSFQ
jgi:hypothetical protein